MSEILQRLREKKIYINSNGEMMTAAPVAPKHPHTIKQHGHTRVDDYYWFRNRENPAVMEYLQQENEFQEKVMEHTRPLQEQLFQEMKGRIPEDDSTVPEQRGEYFYYKRSTAGQQYPLYCRKKRSLAAREEIILDQNTLAEGRSFCRIGAFAVSPDHKKLAYSIDPDGSENCTVFIKDLTTGNLYPEQIQNTYGNVYLQKGLEWGNDSQTLFYISLDQAARPYKIYRHILGTNPNKDALLYCEADQNYFLWLLKTRSQSYITAWSHSTTTDEWRILSADRAFEGLRVFQPRRSGIEYKLEHAGDRFYILTNQDAFNFKLMSTPIQATSWENWQELVPHREDVLIADVLVFEKYLVLLERKNALKQICYKATSGLAEFRYIPLPEQVYDIHPTENPEFLTELLRFEYSSLVTPVSVVDYHMDDDEWELKKQVEIPSGHDPHQYVSERLFATALDGQVVPLSIFHKKGLVKNSNNPILLQGYGSYGFCLDAEFSANRLSLIERGFVFAIAHIRGGSELGRGWYEDGRLLNKVNSFTDFIAAAEHLVESGYTCPEKLSILGVSAGGLLVGACLTMRPDLFGAVIAKVPFVDVVSTMSDPSIPLTTLEYSEWGNPADKTFFDYLLSYSPYDNIRKVSYPKLLITTGFNDPRVAYWEPVKFAAKLRAHKTDENLLLLRTNMEAGHAGSSGRYDSLKEVALEYAFLLDCLADHPV